MMRDRVAPGQCWERRRDGVVVRVRQVWRTDRQVLLTDETGDRVIVGFAELRRRYRQVEPR